MSQSPAWKALSAHAADQQRLVMADLFAADSQRFARFSASAAGMLLDYSKNRITTRTMDLLCELAGEREVEARRDAMFAGEILNSTEQRAALHVALRGGADGDYSIDGDDVSTAVTAVLARMQAFTNGVRGGETVGATGKRFTDVVAIGIGGSHLGPEMAVTALRNPASESLNVHFIANVDGHDVLHKLMHLNAETTLIVVASKTFTTQETMTNATTVKAWITHIMGADAVAGHFVALSTNTEAVAAFGIKAEWMFPFWDWVGGRYSLWSAIGLPIALALGWPPFEALLAGAREMDNHFRTVPLAENLPVLLALIGIWNINFQGHDCLAILPYDERLKRLPAFLQQLDMESNGKSVTQSGEAVGTATGPVVFGEPGTNGQHAFYQLLHQGPQVVPADFIAVANPGHGLKDHHDQLLSNVLAQSRALMLGRTLAEADGNPHRVFAGNRPSNTLVLEHLDAHMMGQLIALYEHKVFVQGIIWGINSFDQWGVELGKELAGQLLAPISTRQVPKTTDSSTAGLLHTINEWRK
ncbi:MAG: glucose-6-phosphate isomerase [Rhodospirillales bacterium]|nr:glucose-6-phosphate isomerase [Rhodospirillales bacterium]